MLTNILLIIHLIVAVAIVILTLLQQGKGSDMGAAFGGGSSQSLFGARGSANFLSRATSILVTVFFLSSMTLAYIYTTRGNISSIATDSVINTQPASAEDIPLPEEGVIPVVPEGGNSGDSGEESDVPSVPE